MSQENETQLRTAVVVGAGPAGLTAAYEIAAANGSWRPVVFELSDEVGGISRTVNHNGNRIDIGGHRFFSKSQRVNQWWQSMLPMIRRPRVSRIFYLRRFFDYPISLRFATFRNMGLGRTIKAAGSYLASAIHKGPERSLEDFYINRFGRQLYRMFFEDYTRKVWGLHPSQLGADWGRQRVKGVSVRTLLKNALLPSKKRSDVETSLISEFSYPQHGPGQLWETVADNIRNKGGEVALRSEVTAVNIGTDRRVNSVEVTGADGSKRTVNCDALISSMPLKQLIPALRGIDVPDEVMEIATSLEYRDFITVGLLVDRLAITNTTKTPTFENRLPDTWIYIQERDVNIGRMQIFNNWSPAMVADNEHTMWIGLEYFCSEGDELWSMSRDKFIEMAVAELVKTGFLRSDTPILDSVQIKVQKAYPTYHGAYYRLNEVIEFLDTIPNLYCIGRNGQHRYNNMDHSMLTAFAAVDHLLGINNEPDARHAIWQVNTDQSHHES